MKRIRYIQAICLSVFAVVLSFQTSTAAASDCKHSKNAFNCVEFLRNYDGDTFTVRIPSVHPLFGEEISVRILGIDAPEIRSKDTCEKRAAERAQKELGDLLKDSREISLRSVGRDKYFRVLAEVVVDGRDVAGEMLRVGLAVPYDGGTRPTVDWCQK